MDTANGIKEASKNIVMAYVHHIREQVDNKNEAYINLGVDADFDSYGSLFRCVLSHVLNIENFMDVCYDTEVLTECIHEVRYVLDRLGYEKLLDNRVMTEFIYEVCVVILEKVKTEEFNDSVKKYYH